MSKPPPAVEMRAITKRFASVTANDCVSFAVLPGEIHALLGENGAGKSTLMSILCGLYRPDEGQILIDGAPVSFQSPGGAIQAGIGMVHQHFMLVPSQTVAENVILGLKNVPFWLNPRQVESQVRSIGERYGLPVDPRAKVWQLSVGEQQRVEIIKVLYRGAEILILDEPTAVLTPQEADKLFDTLRSMAAAGKTIIFISHKLDEILSIADRITVLQAGQTVVTVDADQVDKAELARLMVGREVLFRLEKRPAQPKEVRLSIQDVHAQNDKGLPALRGLSLSVQAGQIVGIAGVAGNGQRELAEVICGLRSADSGRIDVAGQMVREPSPLAMIEAGVAYVPEDRSGTGSAPNLSVTENLALKSYRRPAFGGRYFVNRQALAEEARHLVERFQISPPDPDNLARRLSGGNLQKLILAREIGTTPQVLVAASPTRGLDIGATEGVRRVLLQARDAGAAILLISEDLDEIFALADHIAVIFEGLILGSMEAAAADLETVGRLMAGDAPAAPLGPRTEMSPGS